MDTFYIILQVNLCTNFDSDSKSSCTRIPEFVINSLLYVAYIWRE